ncbi:hypothetical protein BDR07DRAFT_1484989 [Suillus spraguei]|nr:hypothetical protein BDR07DRAFT_1484989 [Suillus spraguei]
MPVGVLTSDDRDCWADNYQHLLSLLPANANASIFHAINESIMALSLDHYTAMPSCYPTPTSPSSSQPSYTSVPALDSNIEIHAHLHNTCSPPQAQNRFFDKSLTLSLEHNGIIFDYGVIAGIDSSAFLEPVPCPLTLEEACMSDSGKGWSHLDWVTNEQIEGQIREAEGWA